MANSSSVSLTLRLHRGFQDIAHFGLNAAAVLSGPHADGAMHLIGHISDGNGWHLSKPMSDLINCSLAECNQFTKDMVCSLPIFVERCLLAFQPLLAVFGPASHGWVALTVHLLNDGRLFETH